MTQEEAAEIVERQQAGLAAANQANDLNRGTPVAGDDGSIGGGISFYTLNRAGAGGVGGPASFVSEVDGKYRTSIVY